MSCTTEPLKEIKFITFRTRPSTVHRHGSLRNHLWMVRRRRRISNQKLTMEKRKKAELIVMNWYHLYPWRYDQWGNTPVLDCRIDNAATDYSRKSTQSFIPWSLNCLYQVAQTRSRKKMWDTEFTQPLTEKYALQSTSFSKQSKRRCLPKTLELSRGPATNECFLKVSA